MESHLTDSPKPSPSRLFVVAAALTVIANIPLTVGIIMLIAHGMRLAFLAFAPIVIVMSSGRLAYWRRGAVAVHLVVIVLSGFLNVYAAVLTGGGSESPVGWFLLALLLLLMSFVLTLIGFFRTSQSH